MTFSIVDVFDPGFQGGGVWRRFTLENVKDVPSKRTNFTDQDKLLSPNSRIPAPIKRAVRNIKTEMVVDRIHVTLGPDKCYIAVALKDPNLWYDSHRSVLKIMDLIHTAA